MDMKQFLARVEEALGAPACSLHESDRVQALEGWDSLGALSLIALFDRDYGVVIDPNALAGCETVADLAKLAEKGS
jgi:acyl carrier protein